MLSPDILQRCMPRAPRAACEIYAPAIAAAAVEFDLTDPHRLAAALASGANESGQLTKFEEASYFSTPSSRISFIFGMRAPSVETLDAWKAKGREAFDRLFFDHVYGGMMGNAGQGYKYRGLGFGQLTGHDNCKQVGAAIGVDLVAHPELMRDDPVIGARAFFAYLKINRITDPAVDGSEAGFLRSVRKSNPGLADSEFRTHHLARWHEVRRGLGITGAQPVDVAALQRALMAAGFDLPQYGADGDFGLETRTALQRFQRANGLPVTGSPDKVTLAKLGVGAAA
jgi:putative chitinase